MLFSWSVFSLFSGLFAFIVIKSDNTSFERDVMRASLLTCLSLFRLLLIIVIALFSLFGGSSEKQLPETWYSYEPQSLSVQELNSVPFENSHVVVSGIAAYGFAVFYVQDGNNENSPITDCFYPLLSDSLEYQESINSTLESFEHLDAEMDEKHILKLNSEFIPENNPSFIWVYTDRFNGRTVNEMHSDFSFEQIEGVLYQDSEMGDLSTYLDSGVPQLRNGKCYFLDEGSLDSIFFSKGQSDFLYYGSFIASIIISLILKIWGNSIYKSSLIEDILSGAKDDFLSNVIDIMLSHKNKTGASSWLTPQDFIDCIDSAMEQGVEHDILTEERLAFWEAQKAKLEQALDGSEGHTS